MAKMLEKTQEKMTKWHFVQICGSYIQQIDDVDEHIHQLDASKLKEEEEDTIIINSKICKRVLNVITQMPTKVPQKIANIPKTRRTWKYNNISKLNYWRL